MFDWDACLALLPLADFHLFEREQDLGRYPPVVYY